MRPNWGVQVKATAGDTHLGGEDFDNRMVKHFTQARWQPCFTASAGVPIVCHNQILAMSGWQDGRGMALC